MKICYYWENPQVLKTIAAHLDSRSSPFTTWIWYNNGKVRTPSDITRDSTWLNDRERLLTLQRIQFLKLDAIMTGKNNN